MTCHNSSALTTLPTTSQNDATDLRSASCSKSVQLGLPGVTAIDLDWGRNRRSFCLQSPPVDATGSKVASQQGSRGFLNDIHLNYRINIKEVSKWTQPSASWQKSLKSFMNRLLDFLKRTLIGITIAFSLRLFPCSYFKMAAAAHQMPLGATVEQRGFIWIRCSNMPCDPLVNPIFNLNAT